MRHSEFLDKVAKHLLRNDGVVATGHQILSGDTPIPGVALLRYGSNWAQVYFDTNLWKTPVAEVVTELPDISMFGISCPARDAFPLEVMKRLLPIDISALPPGGTLSLDAGEVFLRADNPD